ncbi:alanine dehydrogenase [Reichenbachiella carrageenanivorans]|uniref:alanine dehydrogenase n=1 Tax=Reichenbachiella carrageenanivorans TaxID=2979869 RepID=A0ABY6D071_9BACT|nr:alanine dehydrogenase [Reichenbachiella carrageenanivorans]UXX79574.1 alanine dehydrogenase [Reichenbachiella carrageenanivorans]
MNKHLMGSVSALVEESKLYPQEKLAAIRSTNQSLNIGIPKENSKYENRVPLTPKAVGALTSQGHRVLMEAGTGDTANFFDKEYTDAGANITTSANEVFKSDLILKVEFPTKEEIEMMSMGKTIISTIHADKDLGQRLSMLNDKKATAIGYEFIEDQIGGLPIVRAMSEIVGAVVIPTAAEYLTATQGGIGVILGGITGVPPTNVVILGAGTVAEYAARTSLGLGATVKVFDRHLYKLHRLKQILSSPVFTSTIDQVALKKALMEADVVIGAVRADKGVLKKIVSEDMVKAMKSSAVVMDVSIDEGGCFETSRPTNLKNPVFEKFGVRHYCVPNIASKVPRTSTKVLSNIFTPILNNIAHSGGVDQMIFENKWFMKGVYTYKGYMTNYHLSQKFKLRFKDLNLLMAARF